MTNPNTDLIIMTALAQTLIATPNTAFAQQSGQYFIEDEFTMTNTAQFPVLHLQGGNQIHQRSTYRNYEGSIQVIVRYMNRFDRANVTIDQVRRAINTDLNLMKDYLLGNDQLVNGTGLAQARGIPQLSLSPYQGEIIDIPGMKVVARIMTCLVDILDYDVP